MVKVKNANVGREENYEEGGSSRGGRTGKGKGKRVATEVRLPEGFISFKEAANFEEWTRKRRKIAPGHRVDLFDIEGMEIIPNLYEDIGWGPLLTVNELYYLEIIYEFYSNLHKGRVQKQGNITYQWVTSRVGGILVRGGQDDNDESDEDDEENEEQEAMNVDEEESEEEPEEETLEEK
ncbi:hypothetical protein M9H77_12697 [Catharanthus roseus]|uniref:Uncharacterized protein n=1 Tax=Catharanthus roseus TaxID=4058 RepID=A0ACC0BI99_CATRO|nr:hypothetical protein M9H77_12697 [Catharanthus roseus]